MCTTKDFRMNRKKLPAEAFAITTGDMDAPPTDLIPQDTWEHLVHLTDDVSLRTSDRYGTVLYLLNEISDEYTCMVLALQEQYERPENSPISYVTSDSSDELDASIHNALVGYYREGFSILRNIVEYMTIGLALEPKDETIIFNEWLKGEKELGFGWAADNVKQFESVSLLESKLQSSVRDNLFQQKSPNNEGGFVRRFFKELSCYTHGEPGFKLGDMWESNGPIFVDKIFEKWAINYLKTAAYGVIAAKFAQPKIEKFSGGSKFTVNDFLSYLIELITAWDKEPVVIKAVHKLLY
jgi:hypothetical protein